MRFTKMQGCGNDYVYIDCFCEAVADPSELAKKIADRHFGVGGDGLILIEPSDRSDAKMRMFNRDGSEGDMCGNGIRCVAKYVYDHGLIPASRHEALIDTRSGVRAIELSVEEGKVVLFAPTYRGANRKNAFYPYELIDFEGLYRYCLEKDACVLFKMHPWVATPVPIEARFADRFLDVGTYPNINDLFYITDLLITDYSSSMYEFSLMRRPMLFFAYDKNQYANSRGFHREYDSNVPGKIVYTFDELLRSMEEEDYEFWKVEEYLRFNFTYIDENNTDRVIDWLILDGMPEQYLTALAERKKRVAEVRRKEFPCLKEALQQQ